MFYGHVALEVYTTVGGESLRPWKCILVSRLKTQGPGSVSYFLDRKPKAMEVCTFFVTENPRSWKCIPFSELKIKGLGIAHYYRNWKFKDLGMYTFFGTDRLLFSQCDIF